MKSVAFAYVHWTVGRAALVFGFVNMFFGIARYRTEFTLGYWAEALLAFWIAALVIVSLLCKILPVLRNHVQDAVPVLPCNPTVWAYICENAARQT